MAVADLEGGFPSYTGDPNYYPGGIFRTEDGGENWTRVALGPNDGRNGFWIMRTVPTDPPMIITFGMGTEGLGENLDFCEAPTWAGPGKPLETSFETGSSTTSTSPAMAESSTPVKGTPTLGRVSRDGGESWSRSGIHQVNGPIAVSPADPALVLFGSCADVRRSLNGLGTVEVVMEAPSPVWEIVFAPSDANIVYAETDGYVLYRSDDARATWRFLVNIQEDVLNAQP